MWTIKPFLLTTTLICILFAGEGRADDKEIISLACTWSDRKPVQKFDLEIGEGQILLNGVDLTDVDNASLMIRNQFIVFDRRHPKRADHWRIDRGTGAFTVYSEVFDADHTAEGPDDLRMLDDPPVIDTTIRRPLGKLAATGTCQKANRLF